VRAADGNVGAVTSDHAFESDLYEAELDMALDDLTSQASDFRAQGPESTKPSGRALTSVSPTADSSDRRRRGARFASPAGGSFGQRTERR
jgi:hypothetical protein